MATRLQEKQPVKFKQLLAGMAEDWRMMIRDSSD
jgi:hypothetical protein